MEFNQFSRALAFMVPFETHIDHMCSSTLHSQVTVELGLILRQQLWVADKDTNITEKN